MTGFLVDTTGDYFWPFLVAASISLLGVLAYAVVIERVEPVLWNTA